MIQKLGVSKKFLNRSGMSRFLVENFLSHSTEKNRRGTLQCFNTLGYWKNLCIAGLCHDFLSNFFFLTIPKNIVVEPLRFRENF